MIGRPQTHDVPWLVSVFEDCGPVNPDRVLGLGRHG